MTMIKMQPYVSLDLETTGLDPELCQIIEIGAVFDDPRKPLAECPTFHALVRHKLYVGEPAALGMHSRILKLLATQPEGIKFVCVDDLAYELVAWVKDCGWNMKERPLLFAGKNFGGFDFAFLRRLSGFMSAVKFRHRFLDPGSMYFDPFVDEIPPDSGECLRRAGLEPGAAHEALSDALDVCKIIRRRYGIPL
jgi:hypothetical protein